MRCFYRLNGYTFVGLSLGDRPFEINLFAAKTNVSYEVDISNRETVKRHIREYEDKPEIWTEISTEQFASAFKDVIDQSNENYNKILNLNNQS